MLSESQRAAVAERILRARVRLALSRPFLATSIMRLPVRELTDPRLCPTAATDGYHIFYNPGWIHGLGDNALRGLLAHEVLHVVFAHASRCGQRVHEPWNWACDFAINGLLLEQGFKLPKGALFDRRFLGMTAERIYGELDPKAPPAGAPQPLSSQGEGDPDSDNTVVPSAGIDLLDPDDPRVRPLRAPDAPDAEQLADIRRELRNDILARLPGSRAGSFLGAFEASDAASIDWRALLRSWLTERIKSDWVAYPFSKRYLHRGLFMPSPSMAAPGHIVFAIDTSASMSSRQLAHIAAELRAFRETFPCRTTVIQADAAIHAIDDYEAMDGLAIPEQLKLVGRGGTDFRPVFEWADRHAPDSLVLYATDGLGSFPDRAPIQPVIWLLTGRWGRTQPFPFGFTVRIGEGRGDGG